MSDSNLAIYGENDAQEDFPVLKAFQQYIDAEQAKARKRLIYLGIFFTVLMFAVIAVFVALLVGVTNRNQTLNDRLVEFAMQERSRSTAAAPVVVQPPAQQDASTIVALTEKIDNLRKELNESQKRADEAALAAKKARELSIKQDTPTPQEIEIMRLKEMLSKEKAAVAAEKEKQRQMELEAYRRKHYPECYEDAATKAAKANAAKAKARAKAKAAADAAALNDEYDLPSEEELEDELPPVAKPKNRKRKTNDADIDDLLKKIKVDSDGAGYIKDDDAEKPAKTTEAQKTAEPVKTAESKVEPAKIKPSEVKDKNAISVEVGGSSSDWVVP